MSERIGECDGGNGARLAERIHFELVMDQTVHVDLEFIAARCRKGQVL